MMNRAVGFSLIAPAAYAIGSAIHPFVAQIGGENIIEKLLQPGNLAASTLLFFNVLGFMKGWIVPKYVYDAAIHRADRMEAIAMQMLDAMKAATNTTAKTAEAVQKAAAMTPGNSQ